MLSTIADIVGIAAFIGTFVGFFLGRRELRRQQTIVEATQKAVEAAMRDLQERNIAAILGHVRWIAADFQRSCRDGNWPRATFAGDLLRFEVSRLLTTNGLANQDRTSLRTVFDDIKIIHDKIHRPDPVLTEKNMKGINNIIDVVNHIHGRHAVPALSIGAINEQPLQANAAAASA